MCATGGYTVRRLRGPRAIHPATRRALLLVGHVPHWAQPIARLAEHLVLCRP